MFLMPCVCIWRLLGLDEEQVSNKLWQDCWAFVLGPSSSGALPSLVLDGGAKPQRSPVHNLGSLLGS